jgi:hypothetical protein
MTLALRSRACQIAAVMVTCLAVAALHRHSDGLWFQGDAPRHAVNGLFWWDLVHALPRDPVAYAVRYYARYPVIAPVTYPPLFYLVEGLAFAAFGSSPYVAKALVLVFAIVAGLYTMAWARRWIGEPAGWAGAFLAFIPGMVLWSNTVMLNVPATALGLGSLYHFRRWRETGRTTQCLAASGFAFAVLLTYYPGGIVLCVLVTWALVGGRPLRFDRRLLWIAGIALMASVPLLAAVLLAPVHTSRQLPTIALLTSSVTWTFYWRVLPTVVGMPALAAGAAGAAGALLTSKWRGEACYVGSWILVLILTLSLLPARDPRYVLLVIPAFILAAAMGVAWAAERVPPLAPAWQTVVLVVGLVAGLWSAAGVQVPQVSGFREIATYLQRRAPADAVLYDGPYDGLFGFHVRASDPHFERRLVLADKLVYEVGPTTTFKWVQKSNVTSTDDVVTLLRSRCGCHWVAIEVDTRPIWVSGQRLLRQAVARSEFEFVESFTIAGAGERRVDLYRITADVQPVTTADLSFPSLNNREFLHVAPIAR